jgi:hypothetical protein
MTASHGKARLFIDCPVDFRCEQTVYWTLLEGELADGSSWLAEVRGLDMFTGDFGKRIVQPGCQYRLALLDGRVLSRILLHEVKVNTYGAVRGDIPLEPGGPYLGSAYLLLASPDYPPYTLKPPFDGRLAEPHGRPYIPFDYLGWLETGEQEAAADCGPQDCGAENDPAAGLATAPANMPLDESMGDYSLAGG